MLRLPPVLPACNVWMIFDSHGCIENLTNRCIMIDFHYQLDKRYHHQGGWCDTLLYLWKHFYKVLPREERTNLKMGDIQCLRYCSKIRGTEGQKKWSTSVVWLWLRARHVIYSVWSEAFSMLFGLNPLNLRVIVKFLSCSRLLLSGYPHLYAILKYFAEHTPLYVVCICSNSIA